MSFETARLRLRQFDENDSPAIVSAMAHKQVVAMLEQVPWPYTAADAHQFVTEIAAAEPLTFAIEFQGRLIGAVSGQGHLGYWLVPDVWGQGFATEAARAVAALHFARGKQALPSGHRIGNARSRRVLQKLGFRDTDQRNYFCKAESCEVLMQNMELTHAAWRAS